MKSLRKIASQLLGFDRREKRAAYVLVAILFVLVIFKTMVFRNDHYQVETIVMPAESLLIKSVQNPLKESEVGEPILFRFDPNNATSEELISLGLTEKQVNTLINYRKAGARFRKADDLARVYGIDTALVRRLSPWVVIVEKMEKELHSSTKRLIADSAEKITPLTNAPVAFVKTDLNRCSAADLEKLPGIGPVLSERIIKYRNLMGGFADVRQLSEVYGIDTLILGSIYDRVIVCSDDIVQLMIDTCSYEKMTRHPYIGPEAARGIMKFRRLIGNEFTLEDLVIQHVITPSQRDRMKAYVSTCSSVK